ARADPAAAAVDDLEALRDLDLARRADLLDQPVADEDDRAVDDVAAFLPDDERLRRAQREALAAAARGAHVLRRRQARRGCRPRLLAPAAAGREEDRERDGARGERGSPQAQRTSSPATQTRTTRVESSSGLPSRSATSASRPADRLPTRRSI